MTSHRYWSPPAREQAETYREQAWLDLCKFLDRPKPYQNRRVLQCL